MTRRRRAGTIAVRPDGPMVFVLDRELEEALLALEREVERCAIIDQQILALEVRLHEHRAVIGRIGNAEGCATRWQRLGGRRRTR